MTPNFTPTADSAGGVLLTADPLAPTLALADDTGVSSTDAITADPAIIYTPSAASDTLLYKAGTPQPFDAAAVSDYLRSNRDLLLRMHFTLGTGRCTFYTCDLTHDYVRLNADYTT